MTRLILALLFVVGCAEDLVPTDNLTGGWRYTWTGSETLRGWVEIDQRGDAVYGRIGFPEGSNNLPEYWDWRLAGTQRRVEITAGPGCACEPPPPFVLRCEAYETLFSCFTTQIDGYGDHSGSFVATR